MSKLPNAKAALTALGLGMALTTANAGVINQFDFNGLNQQFSTTASFVGANAAVPSVTVKGYLFNSGNWVAQNVSRINGALGLGTLPGDTGGNTQIGPRVEGLLFDLGETFYGSIRVAFGSFGGNDNTDIWIGTSDMIAGNFSGAMQVANNSASNPFTSPDTYLRYIFVANTDSTNGAGCNSGGNCFRVDSLGVVPEPGSLALVGAGMLAAIALRRRAARRA